MTKGTENAVLTAIKNRRAVRAFRSDPVAKDILTDILEAGNWAPSGGNYQPWGFVVVEDPATRHRLRDSAFPHWERELKRRPLPRALQEPPSAK